MIQVFPDAVPAEPAARADAAAVVRAAVAGGLPVRRQDTREPRARRRLRVHDLSSTTPEQTVGVGRIQAKLSDT